MAGSGECAVMLHGERRGSRIDWGHGVVYARRTGQVWARFALTRTLRIEGGHPCLRRTAEGNRREIPRAALGMTGALS